MTQDLQIMFLNFNHPNNVFEPQILKPDSADLQSVPTQLKIRNASKSHNPKLNYPIKNTSTSRSLSKLA
jgi:hypothetical protein